ncbi:LOW QUALITY PROTEIN: hypothetical protein HID58_042939 [Brassica napus]|uniref:Uncharacterized protein n=1 Tax=Brassica napus TaxID=3708 RepID=A0ABQ8BF50_BRANA|nr:LOW QUALITY PROTEIN: hypothetical protein HID58_042939 [Brassica napus]
MNSRKTCPGSYRKAQHKAILALLVAYLRGKIAIFHMAKNQWQSSTSGSTFSIRHGHYRSTQTTCLRILLRYQESTRLSPSTKTNMLNVPPAKSQCTIPRRDKKLQLQHQNLKEHQTQPMLVESSMRILSFGLQVLLNLLIPLILSLAKILPLRILGYKRSIRIWGMSRNITLYADVPGLSIKLSANSDQSPPWGQRPILIKEKKKVLHAQLDPAVTSCPLGSPTNTPPDLDHVSVSNQGLFPILQAIYLQSGCESFQTDRKYIRALSTREFDGPGYEPTSYSKFNKELDTMVRLTKSYEENHVISCL